MNIKYPTIDEAATPEYILAVLRDMHRQQCQFDPEADPGAVLTFDTTIGEWRSACDLVPWRKLGRVHNQLWGISCSDSEWRAVLEPAGQKQLADVCQLIAGHVVRPVIRPARFSGCTSVSAGAFLTIRSLLREAGASVDEIAPSKPLAPYTRRFSEVFLGPISRLAPGALPQVRISKPVYNVAISILLLAVGCIVCFLFIKTPLLYVAGLVLFAFGYALTWYAAQCLLPTSVEFGELRTFRDLAVVVAKGSQAGFM